MTAPCPSRVYFPVRRVTRPAADAPTLAQIVQWYFEDLDNPPPTESTP